MYQIVIWNKKSTDYDQSDFHRQNGTSTQLVSSKEDAFMYFTQLSKYSKDQSSSIIKIELRIATISVLDPSKVADEYLIWLQKHERNSEWH